MNRYTFDTHVHTSDTSHCGTIAADQIVQSYKQSGYDGIIITDHYHREYFDSLGNIPWEEKTEWFLKGYRAAKREGDAIGVKVLLGMEIRFEENSNDYLVFGIDEPFIQSHKELYTYNLESFRQATKEQGGIIVQAHPCRKGLVFADPFIIDGVEIFNGNARHNSHNRLAKVFAEEYNLKMLSGSDTHELEDLARGGVILPKLPSDSFAFAAMVMDNQISELLSDEKTDPAQIPAAMPKMSARGGQL